MDFYLQSSCMEIDGDVVCCHTPQTPSVHHLLAFCLACFTHTNSSACISAVAYRVLMVAVLALPEDMISAVLVLSIVSAPFSFELAADLLALPVSATERRSMLRRLCQIGLMRFNSGLHVYSMQPAVREAARLLAGHLGALRLAVARAGMHSLQHHWALSFQLPCAGHCQ